MKYDVAIIGGGPAGYTAAESVEEGKSCKISFDLGGGRMI